MTDLFWREPKASSGGEYAGLIADAESRHGIPPGLLNAVITVGERSGSKAVSPKGAMGLAQLMPGTAKEVGVTDPMDPAQSIEGGAKYLSRQLASHNGDARLAVAAYNAGPAAVAKHKGVPPFRETQDYVARVLGPGGYQVASQEPFWREAETSDSTQDAAAEFLQTVGASTAAPKPAATQDAADKFLSDVGAVKAEANALPTNAATGQGLPMAQAKTFRQLAAGGGIDINAQVGTQKLPYVQVKPGVTPSGPGVYYVDLEGKLQQTPGKPVTAGEAFGSGFVQGARDVNASVNNLAGFVDERVPVSKGLNKLIGFDAEKSQAQDFANREGFESRYQDSGAGLGGRITGQIAASTPLMLAGGEVAAPLLRAAGPVGEFVAGRAGGNLLTQTASRATQGAIQGAEGAALTSSQSDRPLGEQIATGAALGGAVNVAAPAVFSAAANTGRAARALFEPFSEPGQQAIANRVISNLAEGGPTAIRAAEIIPGSTPTLAQATANPGLATLERAVRDIRPNPFVARAAQNATAREAALDAVRGDAQSLDDLIELRSTMADPIREKAFASAKPTDPAGVVAKIDEILAGPSGQRDIVQSALGNLRGKIAKEEGQLQTDPAQLYGVRQALTDMLSPMARGTASDARAASRELMQVKDALDTAIEAGAPGYKDYLKTFSEASKPIDEQGLLQSLNLTDARGNITLGKIDAAIKRIESQQTKGGTQAAKSVTDDTMDQLKALRDDFVREGNSGLGKSMGSSTFQNLATNNIVGNMGAPLTMAAGLATKNPIGSLLLGAGKLVYGSKNDEILDRLAQSLLDPSVGGKALDNAQGAVVNNPLLNRLLRGASNAGRAQVGATGNTLTNGRR